MEEEEEEEEEEEDQNQLPQIVAAGKGKGKTIDRAFLYHLSFLPISTKEQVILEKKKLRKDVIETVRAPSPS